MFRSMNVHNFWINRQGSVAVEFIAIALLLVTFMTFVADLALGQINRGRLDRVAYSVAGVLRERAQLYDAREKLIQTDVTQAKALAMRMLKDMGVGVAEDDFQVFVEELHFLAITDPRDSRKLVSLYRRWSSQGNLNCMPPTALNLLTQLTPRGSYDRWVPLYQVTVCMASTSWYMRLLSRSSRTVINSYAIVMAR